MSADTIVVYAHPDGRDYVANFGDDGWKRWPAVEGGWPGVTPTRS